MFPVGIRFVICKDDSSRRLRRGVIFNILRYNIGGAVRVNVLSRYYINIIG